MRFAHWKFLALTALVVFYGPIRGYAALDATVLERADAAYRSEKPADALANYELLLANPEASDAERAALYFNAGNAALQSGKLGWAVAYYARAAKLDPLDADLAFNQDLLEKKLANANRVHPPLPPALQPDLLAHTPADIWLLAALTFSAIALALWLTTKTVAKSLLPFALAFLSSIVFAAAYYVDSIKNSVVITEESIVRSGPGGSFPEIVRIGQGSVLDVRETQAGWYKIAFAMPRSGGKRVVGWAEASSVHRLHP